jgi:hypothetical protein
MQEQEDEYEVNPWGFTVHRIGEVFIDNGHAGEVAHIVAKVDSDPLPTDEDAPSYQARCGVWGMSYSMGSLAMCTFIARRREDVDHGSTNCCPVCFGS